MATPNKQSVIYHRQPSATPAPKSSATPKQPFLTPPLACLFACLFVCFTCFFTCLLAMIAPIASATPAPMVAPMVAPAPIACPSSLTPLQWQSLQTMQARGDIFAINSLTIKQPLPSNPAQIAVVNRLMVSLENVPSNQLTTSKKNLYLVCWRYLTGHIDYETLQGCAQVVDTPASACAMVSAMYGSVTPHNP